MLGGKANRIYFGDPLFDPYKFNHSDSLNITKTVTDSVNATTLDIILTFSKPDAYEAYFPVWDKFHYGDTRIYTPVELPSYCRDVTEFEVIDSSDPYNLVIHTVEHFDGKTILHIEVDIPNDMYSQIDYDITFRVTFLTTGIVPPPTETQFSNLKVFPNPSNNMTTIQFSNPENKNHTLIIYNAKGQVVHKIEAIRNMTVEIENNDLESGMYFFQLQNNDGIAGQGTFIIEN
jgi:hypothetical protein